MTIDFSNIKKMNLIYTDEALKIKRHIFRRLFCEMRELTVCARSDPDSFVVTNDFWEKIIK